MRFEIRPEPDSGARAAILAVLRRVLDRGRPSHPAYASRWRRSGLDLDGAPSATARSRRNRSRAQK